MILVFDIAGEPKYKLIKRDPGWELMYYDAGGAPIFKGPHRGKLTKSGWKKMAQGQGLYPHNIRHALDLIMDDIILSHGRSEVPVVDGLREIRSLLNKMDARLDEIAEEAASA